MNNLRTLIREMLEISIPSATRELYINGILAEVEVAATEDTRNRGLMFRDRLIEGSGMLFLFSDSAPRSFWMKNTYIPLSIAYINESGQILNIEDMIPFNMSGVRSNGPAMCALEMNRGWFSRNGIRPGDYVEGLPLGAFL
tara:strand:+ start:706 stop:1128 length:423 start_codon:yes stop_codon:yes gene_type:complete